MNEDSHAKHIPVQTTNSSEADSDNDNDHKYEIPALQKPAQRRFSHSMYDDESNQYFMSEPSISEDGDASSGNVVRAPHRALTTGRSVHSSSDDDRQDNHRRAVAHQSPIPNSPGNTSLSSWDTGSPAARKLFLFHFLPERAGSSRRRGRRSSSQEASYSGAGNRQAQAAAVVASPPVSSHSNNRRSNGEPQPRSRRHNSNIDDEQQPVLVPRPSRIAAAGEAPSASLDLSQTPIQEQQQQTHHQEPLRGMERFLRNLRLQSGGLAFFLAQNHDDNGPPDNAEPSRLPIESSGQSVQDKDDGTLIAEHLLSPGSSVQSKHQYHHQPRMDESIAMTLSDDSEQGEDPEQETCTRSLMMLMKQEWEEAHNNNSADDEQTNIRPPRAKRRAAPMLPGHKRSRSGDGAAATLATGGSWRGMEQDRIPLPSTDENEDDEEEGPAETIPPRDSYLGRPPTHPPTSYERLERRPWSSEAPQRAEQEASSLTHQQHKTHAGSYGSTERAYSWVSGQHYQYHRSKSYQYHTGHNTEVDEYRNPYYLLQTQSAINPQGHQDQILDMGCSQDQLRSVPAGWTGHVDVEESGDSEDDYDESGEENDDGSDALETRDVQRNRLEIGGSVDLHELERKMEDTDFRGKFQKVLRSHHVHLPDSPFANIGKKSAEKAPRRMFLPLTSMVEDDKNKYRFYTCPRCGTRQREFFTVSSAPNQVSGPSSYLALYFALYVTASLFIFGLEEGWKPLDCLYFAVMTLTTCGLGDFVPTTSANKIICSIFLYFGVSCIGLLLGSYIASLLDDKASRDRKSRQMDSCPNCKQIQTLKETASRITGTDRSLLDPEKPKLMRFMSERTAIHPQDHAAAYNPTRGRHSSYGASLRSSSSIQFGEAESGRFNDPTSADKICEPNEAAAVATSDFAVGTPPGLGTPHIGIGFQPSPPSHSSNSPQSYSLLSPVTRRILGRQGHTRHESIDLSNRNGFGTAFGVAAVHQHSLESLIDPSVAETAPLNPPSTGPSSYCKQQSNGDRSHRSHYSDYSDSSSDGSTSSASTILDVMDDNTFQMRAAKYVFLTLRQALVNSMVIIAFGCLGFWFIEGFSLIDSWYFTTVLLTTTGYGDITPVTQGGKLFAIIYILVAGTILLNNMSQISMIPLELRRRRIERAVLTQFGDQLDDAALRELATGPTIQRLRLSANRPDGLDECTREMFSLAMLVRLGKVTENDILETFSAFRRLDVNDEGVLNSKSIIAGMIRSRHGFSSGRRRKCVPPNRHTPPPPPPPPLPPPPPTSALTPTQPSVVFHNEPPPVGPFMAQQKSHQLQQYWLLPQETSPSGGAYNKSGDGRSSSYYSRGGSSSGYHSSGSSRKRGLSNESPF